MLACLDLGSPAVFMEHKLVSPPWLEFLGSGGRETVSYDVPASGTRGPVPSPWQPIPLGKAALKRDGSDITIATLGVGVHRAMQAASTLDRQGISAAVLDLRSVAPLDKATLCEEVGRTGRLLVVDEDYEGFGLSGELAATALEAGIVFKFARVCTQTTIPYARDREDETLPNVSKIRAACQSLVEA